MGLLMVGEVDHKDPKDTLDVVQVFVNRVAGGVLVTWELKKAYQQVGQYWLEQEDGQPVRKVVEGVE